MANDNIFRALSSPTRIKALKLLSNKEMHLSGLARELDISVPVMSKHIKILERFGFVRLVSEKDGNRRKLKPIMDIDGLSINIAF